MKLKLRFNPLLITLIGIAVCVVLMFGVMLTANYDIANASEEDAQAPTIISVAGNAISNSVVGIPNAIVNTEYRDSNGENYIVVATGSGTLSYSAFEAETGAFNCMPAGLHVNPTTGELYGTITESGTFNFSITVYNEYGSTSILCSINIFTEDQKPIITTESLPNGAVDSDYYQQIEFTGYMPSIFMVTITSGALPDGLSTNGGYGGAVIQGKPTKIGSFSFTVTINTGVGVASKEYTVEITEEAIRPSPIKSATIINEEDEYSFINSNYDICVIKGKPVSVQLVSSGTNTVENPITYDLKGTLPEGLTISESGLITGTPAESIETNGSYKNFYNIYFIVGNKKVDGSPQSTGLNINIVVYENGYVGGINLSPSTTSVARGGTRQFEIDWTRAFGDVDKEDITWSISAVSPTSESTTISSTGLLTVGLDEASTALWIRAIHNPSGKTYSAVVTIVDHTHTTTVVDAVPKTCTTDGNIKHYKCTICEGLFSDALATTTLTEGQVKVSASHDCGTLNQKQNATCSAKGKVAYYECSVCHLLFNSSMVQTTEEELEIAIDPSAHKFGSMTSGVYANCASEGEKAHKDCTYCGKHFDNDGIEIKNLIIEKNDDHLAQAVWSKDGSGHWHACTREGCKDGGKVDFSAHTPSSEEATESADIHCTICEYVIEAVKSHTHGLVLVPGFGKTCIKDGQKAYYVCSDGDYPCGKFFEDDGGAREIFAENFDAWKRIPASHTFGDWVEGTPSNCAQNGEVAHKTCSICSKHFDDEDVEIENIVIEKNDNHVVTDSETLQSDQYGHWHACTREGCKNNGKADYTPHTKSATEATETNNIHCTICSFIIEPIKGHVHELSKVDGYDATCTTDGAKTYYVCSLGENPCGKYFEDEDGKTEITASRFNAWKTISASHTFGDWIDEVPATENEFGVKGHKDCSVCSKHFDNTGVEIADLKIDKLTPVEPDDPSINDTPSPIEPTSPADPAVPTDSTTSGVEENSPLSAGAIAGIAIGGTVVVGVGIFALIWFVIKKKKWSDLVNLFKKK